MASERWEIPIWMRKSIKKNATKFEWERKRIWKFERILFIQCAWIHTMHTTNFSIAKFLIWSVNAVMICLFYISLHTDLLTKSTDCLNKCWGKLKMNSIHALVIRWKKSFLRDEMLVDTISPTEGKLSTALQFRSDTSTYGGKDSQQSHPLECVFTITIAFKELLSCFLGGYMRGKG